MLNHFVRVVLCVVACLSMGLLAVSGNNVRRFNGDGWFEHGWPWTFLIRRTSVESNRFFFWEGEKDFDYGGLALDSALCLGFVLVAVFYTAWRWNRLLQFSLLRLLLLIFVASLPFAYVEWLARGCRRDNEVLSEIPAEWGVEAGKFEYVGPLWLERITGHFDDRLCCGVRITDHEKVAQHSQELAAQLRKLKYINVVVCGDQIIAIDTNLEKRLLNAGSDRDSFQNEVVDETKPE